MTSPRTLLPSVNSHRCDELCMGHGATLSKANHVLPQSTVSFTPRTVPGTFSRSSHQEVVPSGSPAACPGPIVSHSEPSRAGQRQERAVPIGAFEMSRAQAGMQWVAAPPLRDHHSNREGAALSWLQRSGLALSLKR